MSQTSELNATNATNAADATNVTSAADAISVADVMLEAKDLVVGYDKKPLISGVQIALNPGEITVLIGPNGAGKSTILKSITAHLEPVSGVVYLGGKEQKRMSAAEVAKTLSVVLTERLRTELMTCRDIVSAGRYPHTGRLGVLRDEDRVVVRRAMEIMNVTDLAERDFMHISDGQRQRVLIARAICQEPRVMILDEPTSFLDVRYQIQMLRAVRKLAKEQGVAVMMSLHELDMAQKIADRVIAVKGDRVFAYGTPQQIFTGEMIEQLYDLDNGSYNSLFGSIEMGRVQGDPRVFVVAGAGTGADTFRVLSHAGIPFAVGVLNRGDVDHALAVDIATTVVEAPAFEPVGEAEVAQACSLVDSCEAVICCVESFGVMNSANQKIVEHARAAGKPVVSSFEELGW